jgi:methionyl-tRNA formyltransferase
MTRSDLRLVFAGTPEFAAVHLDGLVEAGYLPVAVYTQPDRPAGRGKKLTASPVKARALEAGLPVLQPSSLKSADARAQLASLRPDLLIVVAYGLILPQPVLDTPSRGCINVHASLLPKWRGAAPIQRAIEAGDSETGITIMQMDAGLDTGPMLASAVVPIGPRMTAGELHDALADAGVPLLLEVLDDLDRAQAAAQGQDDRLASYASKITRDEARLDWNRPADALQRQVRAFNPFPVCWTELGQQRIKIWEAYARASAGADSGEGAARDNAAPGTLLHADDDGLKVACGDGVLQLTRIQLPGGKALPVAELLRARQALFVAGSRFC